jgi:hypothetical protein
MLGGVRRVVHWYWVHCGTLVLCALWYPGTGCTVVPWYRVHCTLALGALWYPGTGCTVVPWHWVHGWWASYHQGVSPFEGLHTPVSVCA